MVIVNVIFGMIPKIGNILTDMGALALVLPSLSVTARRLHDRGKSGWLQLCLNPLIGCLILLQMCLTGDDMMANKYEEPVA